MTDDEVWTAIHTTATQTLADTLWKAAEEMTDAAHKGTLAHAASVAQSLDIADYLPRAIFDIRKMIWPLAPLYPSVRSAFLLCNSLEYQSTGACRTRLWRRVA